MKEKNKVNELDIAKIKSEKPIKELIEFGIINVDKPSGWTSFDVVNHIRMKLGLTKCGHFGTLDPNVTGVLPICLEKTCKIQDLFMHHDKIYVGKMIFHKEIEEKKIKEAIKKFIGKINQLPPRKSRVKRVVREREVKKFEITNFDKEKREVSFVAEVEEGTYIRKLCSDLAESLGVGGQMTELRRIKAGLFSIQDKEFSSIEEIDKIIEEYKSGSKEGKEKLRKLIIPAEIITKLIKNIVVDKKWIDKLSHGSPIFDEMLDNFKEDKKIIFTKELFGVISNNKLIEIAKFSDKFEQKSILAKPESVLV